MATLERAIAIAVEAHAGQQDKNGAPYILHPLRVMFNVEGDDARMVAILHDVVEDNAAWSIERLRAEGFAPVILAGVDALTRRKEESYEAFVARAASDPLGRVVKLADLRDNMDVRRLKQVGEKERERLARYLKAWHMLQAE